MRRPKWIITIALPLAWLIGSLVTNAFSWRLPGVKSQLDESQRLIEDFVIQNQRLPWQLAELRLHARSAGDFWSPYDAFGHGLLYIALSESAFLLKSFGADARENSLGSPVDPSILRGVGEIGQGIRAVTSNLSQPRIYQGAYLDGLQSPAFSLTARLLVHRALRSRRLLVIDPLRPDFSLVSFHDAVEEFLWLPSGYELVFTAQGSQRYEDGVYYWNLKTDRTFNLLDDIRQEFWPSLPAEEIIYTSLSHISEEPPLLYLHAQVARETALDPHAFYRLQNFFAVSLGSLRHQKATIQHVPHDPDYSVFDYPLQHSDLIEVKKQTPRPLQVEWLQLSLSGHPEDLLSQWQEFTSRAAGNPMLPYSLWWLASLYNDSFRYMTNFEPNQAQVLRNFGIEISEALSTLPTAPAHIRAMGEELKKNLLLSRVADYNVSSFTLDREPAPSPGGPESPPAPAESSER